MLPITKYLTTSNKTPSGNKSIKYIVVHDVGAVSSAKNNAMYFKSQYRGASAHYFVDNDSIYQVVDDKDGAWHVGENFAPSYKM